MPNVTGLELALISAGAALAGVALNTAGTGYLDRRRDRRAAEQARDQAIADLLTATVDLMTGVQTIHAAYQQQTTQRHYLRLITVIMAAVGSVTPARENITWQTLASWPSMSRVVDRLLAADQDLDDRKRTAALDLAAIIAPRTARFYAAIAVLTLGPDKKIANAVRNLTPAVSELLEVITAKQKKYDPAHARAEKALATFRAAADQRTA